MIFDVLSDPKLRDGRKKHMLDANNLCSLDDPAPPVRVLKGARCPQLGGASPVDMKHSPSQSEAFSEQTQWMLEVRDRRDRAAFEKLFDHFAPRLKSVMCRNGQSAAQVEDIVQDVMLVIWRKAELFDPERAPVGAWIYQIARNRQIDVFRKLNRPMPEELKLPEETTVDASQVVSLDQEARAVRAALKTLKPAQRELVEQAYLGELTHSEIQIQTGLPLGTIKSRIRLGLEKLRYELKELGLK